MDTTILGLDGKSALVVGGGQGIGEAISLQLARSGCNVAVLDNVTKNAEGTVEKIEAIGQRSCAIVGDVLDATKVDQYVKSASDSLGALDVLVTVVGSTGFQPLLDTTPEQWDIEQNINLRYVFLVGKAFAALCKANSTPGAITAVASVSGIMSAPRHGAYGAAKAGLMHLVKTMAVEWAPLNIRVNSVAPGSIITPRLPDTEEWREIIRASPHPMQRRGSVDEIAKAVLFFCSDLSSYVTGQTLAVDGGLTVANIMNVPKKLKSR